MEVSKQLDRLPEAEASSCKIAASRVGCSKLRLAGRRLEPALLPLLCCAVALALATTPTCLGLPLETATNALPVDVEATTSISLPTAAAITSTTSTTTTTTTTTSTSTTTTSTTESPAVNETTGATTTAKSNDNIEYAEEQFNRLTENLEQTIRHDVDTEIEKTQEESVTPQEVQSVEPPSDEKQSEQQREVEINKPADVPEPQENEAVANVREAKTLDVEESEEKASKQQLPANDETPQALVVEKEKQTASEENPKVLPKETSTLISVILNENRAITEPPINKENLLDLKNEFESNQIKDTTPVAVFEVPKHQVTKKQGVEDLLPSEVSVPEVRSIQKAEVTESEINLEARTIEVTVPPVDKDEIKDDIVEGAAIQEQEEQASTTEIALENVQETTTIITEIIEESKAVVSTSESTQILQSNNVESTSENIESVQQSTPANNDDEQKESESPVTSKVVPSVAIETTTASNGAIENASTQSSQPIKQTIEEELKSDSISDSSEENVEQPDAEPASNESSEELPSGDEPKLQPNDSTASKFISVSPINAVQTVDKNVAEESVAEISFNWSPIVFYITISVLISMGLVHFIVVCQRQHGTLDIEMQEQRLGKDDLGELDAERNLLDVELLSGSIDRHEINEIHTRNRNSSAMHKGGAEMALLDVDLSSPTDDATGSDECL